MLVNNDTRLGCNKSKTEKPLAKYTKDFCLQEISSYQQYKVQTNSSQRVV